MGYFVLDKVQVLGRDWLDYAVVVVWRRGAGRGGFCCACAHRNVCVCGKDALLIIIQILYYIYSIHIYIYIYGNEDMNKSNINIRISTRIEQHNTKITAYLN